MATKTWSAGSAGRAGDGANWVGGVAPVAGDDIIFDGTGTGDCTWNLNCVPTSFSLNSGYTGAVNADMAFSTGALTVAAGTLNTNGYAVSATSFTFSAGTVSLGSSTITLTLGWDSRGTGILNEGTSTVKFTTAGSVYTAAGHKFYNVTKLGAGNTVVYTDITILGNLSTTSSTGHFQHEAYWTDKMIYIYGNITGSKFGVQRLTRITILGAGSVHFQQGSEVWWNEIKFMVSCSTYGFSSYRIYIAEGVTLSMLKYAYIIYFHTQGVEGYFTNLGTIAFMTGTNGGNIQFQTFEYNPNHTIKLGRITGHMTNFMISHSQTGFGSKTWNLGEDLIFPDTRISISGIAGESMTVTNGQYKMDFEYMSVGGSAVFNQGSGKITLRFAGTGKYDFCLQIADTGGTLPTSITFNGETELMGVFSLYQGGAGATLNVNETVTALNIKQPSGSINVAAGKFCHYLGTDTFTGGTRPGSGTVSKLIPIADKVQLTEEVLDVMDRRGGILGSPTSGKYLMRKWHEDRAKALIDKTQFTSDELAWLEMTDAPCPSPYDSEQYLVETQPLDPLTQRKIIDRRTVSPQMGDKDVT